MPEGREVTRTTERVRRRFDIRDWAYIADWVVEEKSRREKRRKKDGYEEAWDEIDRQLRMEPSLTHKKDANGKADVRKAWMSEMELPYQSQTHEVLVADARNMMFPPSGNWFRAHAETPDEYFDKVDFETIILGDQVGVPTQMNQDNADKLVEGWLSLFHRQYDLKGHIDLCNGEAFKYGLGVARMRNVTKQVFMNTSRGVISRKTEFPALIPRSVKNTYPDDSAHSVMHEGFVIGPGDIECRTRKHEDLVMVANRGSNDPDNMNGGWMPSNLSKIEPDGDGNVLEIEFEGDLVVPKKTVSSLYLPNVLVTVVQGSGKEARASVVRFRWRKYPFSSYLWFPYHREDVSSPYATSPLMKGRLTQHGAAQALNRFFDAAALNVGPPLGYNKNDPYFAVNAPVVEPYALWETVDGVEVHGNIGDPTAMLAGFTELSRQYYDQTSVNAPRLGAQTVSHTTAYAKNVEAQKGQARTVDYVRATLDSVMTRFLSMEYEMALDTMGRRSDSFFIDSYKGYVEIERSHLPDRAMFEAFGAGGPAEEQQRRENKVAAVQLAMQIDALNVQMGKEQTLDLAAIIKEILSEGGWSDVDTFVRQSEGAAEGTPAESGLERIIGGAPGVLTSSLPTG